MAGRRCAAVRSTQQCRVDGTVGFNPESFIDHPADGAEHRIVTRQENGDSLADTQRGRGLPTDARFGHVADCYVELSKSRARESAFHQARLARLTLVGRYG